MAAAVGVSLKPIPGFTGYEASDDGRIFSRLHRTGFGPPKVAPDRPPRELRQFDRRTRKGEASPYLSVSLGRGRTRYVHELVLLAWRGPRPGSPAEVEACHGPNGSKDNSVSNLRWDTVASNIRDRDEGHLEHHEPLRYEDYEGAFDGLI